MIKETHINDDPIFMVFQVVQNYKKRGISTILLTIDQIEDILEAASYSINDPLMIDCLNSARYTENTHSNLRISTQKKFDKNKKKLLKKSK